MTAILICARDVLRQGNSAFGSEHNLKRIEGVINTVSESTEAIEFVCAHLATLLSIIKRTQLGNRISSDTSDQRVQGSEDEPFG